MTHAELTHPLATTIERITMLNDYLNVQLGAPEGDGWIGATDLAAHTSPQRDNILSRIAEKRSTRDRHYLATSFWSAYLWQVVTAGVASYLTAQRVPDLAPTNVVLHFDAEDWADTIAFVSGRFAALPDDPAAGHPDVLVVPDRAALHSHFLKQITERYAAPMIETLRGKPLGVRALWAYLADECAGAMLWLGQELGQHASCADEALALVQRPPLKGKTGILQAEHAGRIELFLNRASCCLSYKVGDHGYCTTCPLRPVEERVRLYEEWMAEEAAKA